MQRNNCMAGISQYRQHDSEEEMISKDAQINTYWSFTEMFKGTNNLHQQVRQS